MAKIARTPRARVAALLAALAAAAIAGCRDRAATASGPPPAPSEATLERGRYLVEAGGCIDCHTRAGGPQLAGGRPLQSPFGVVYSTNITPSPEGIGSWSSDAFYRALHEGVDARGRHLYPAFPYGYFTELSRADADAIFAYLRSQPAVDEPPRPNRLPFPFSVRALLGPWKLLFLSTGPFRPDPRRSPEWNRGAYLVEGIGHCGACHTPRNLIAASERERDLQGGTTGLWTAPDLTPNPITGLGRWRRDEIVAYLRTGQTAHGVASAEMREEVEGSTSRMSDADLAAIAVYLQSLAPSRQPVSPPGRGQMREGEAIWLTRCAACHGGQGQGYAPLAPALQGASIVLQSDPTTLVHVILSGIDDGRLPVSMPAFGGRLSDAQIAAVATYVRNAWGRRAGPAHTAAVAALRRIVTGEEPPRIAYTQAPPTSARGMPASAQGAVFFRMFNCSGCHGAQGGGGGGRPLTGRLRHGDALDQIHASIAQGRPNGMPAFAGVIPDPQIWRLAEYVRSLSQTATASTPPPAR